MAGLGAMAGFGEMEGFWEREGSVCCFFSLLVLAGVLPGGGGVAMLPVELVLGRFTNL